MAPTVKITDSLLADLRRFASMKARETRKATPTQTALRTAKVVSRLSQAHSGTQQPVTITDLVDFWKEGEHITYAGVLARVKEALSYGLISSIGNPTKGSHYRLIRNYSPVNTRQPGADHNLIALASEIEQKYGIRPE